LHINETDAIAAMSVLKAFSSEDRPITNILDASNITYLASRFLNTDWNFELHSGFLYSDIAYNALFRLFNERKTPPNEVLVEFGKTLKTRLIKLKSKKLNAKYDSKISIAPLAHALSLFDVARRIYGKEFNFATASYVLSFWGSSYWSADYETLVRFLNGKVLGRRIQYPGSGFNRLLGI
jgi:hypothetical protein